MCLYVHLHLAVYVQLCKYDTCGQPFDRQVSGQWFSEIDKQILFHGIFHAVQLVVLVQPVYLFAFVPVSETALEQCQRLGVYPVMIDRCAVVYFPDGDGQESTVCPDVLQALTVVGAPDEGAMPRQGEGFHIIHFSLRYVVLRNDSFQSSQVSGSYAFKFLHIDDDPGSQ